MGSNDKETLELIRYYKKSWLLLQKFDDGSLGLYKSDVGENFTLGYDEVLTAVDELKRELIKRGEASNIFGVQKADEFEGIIKNIYQTFGGCDLLTSPQEKAANLIYYIIKDHLFSDGNKRIGSFIFILFLSKCRLLYKSSGELRINDNALVALALFIAQSEPKQKDMMVNLITNLLVD
ncbi:type II toxin-antitoxin system death-on-curing family toxin [Campylobacter concisus]|uniref:type II toxin-antitoxin system death-on-curing family toxin n=1 Tax=Campylobacter concisus TaxID=199 RepID=UPI000CD93891|nr:Fic family protein [Campylobacter concisus]